MLSASYGFESNLAARSTICNGVTRNQHDSRMGSRVSSYAELSDGVVSPNSERHGGEANDAVEPAEGQLAPVEALHAREHQYREVEEEHAVFARKSGG